MCPSSKQLTLSNNCAAQWLDVETRAPSWSALRWVPADSAPTRLCPTPQGLPILNRVTSLSLQQIVACLR